MESVWTHRKPESGENRIERHGFPPNRIKEFRFFYVFSVKMSLKIQEIINLIFLSDADVDEFSTVSNEPEVEYTEVVHPRAADPTRGNLLRIPSGSMRQSGTSWAGPNYL